jgi:anhydro-N-acetylmuramic acid kinase
MSTGGPSPRYYVGTISGTSVDGLDLALVDLARGITLIATATAPFTESLRDTLLDLGQPGADDLDRIGEADAELGDFIGRSVNDFLERQALTGADVIAIGSHGQTIRHRPDARHPFTWQIGDPNRIAELTGITTVADFRRRDMAAAGQGAPLAPAFHEALFRSAAESRVILNIGGIGNVTFLRRDASLPVTGFDTGPGNALMDVWAARHTGASYDADGRWAASGTLDRELLRALLADDYFRRPPPKSTGREHFTAAWLDERIKGRPGSASDVQRTLAELTAESIAGAIARWTSPCDRVIVCGGGRRNAFLMSLLTRLGVPVDPSEAHGVDGDSIEAAAFAWLAARRLALEPGSADGVTGATGPRVLGGVYPG